MTTLLLLTLVLALLAATPVSAAPAPKVDLCHIAQGSGNLIPITVSETAVEAHLAHGDILVGDGVTSYCDAIPVPDVTVGGEFVNSAGQTVADGNGLTFHYQGQQWTDTTLVYPEEYWGNYPLYVPGAFVGALVWVDFAGPQEEVFLTLTAQAHELATDGTRIPLAGNFLQDAFWLGIGDQWSPASGGYEWLVPNQAKGLYVIELKIYDGDPVDDQLLYHLDMVFCPPEV